MKPTTQQLEQKIEEVLSYLLSHNMADMGISEFWKLTNEFHVLCAISESSNIKSYRTGNYMDSYKLIK